MEGVALPFKDEFINDKRVFAKPMCANGFVGAHSAKCALIVARAPLEMDVKGGALEKGIKDLFELSLAT